MIITKNLFYVIEIMPVNGWVSTKKIDCLGVVEEVIAENIKIYYNSNPLTLFRDKNMKDIDKKQFGPTLFHRKRSAMLFSPASDLKLVCGTAEDVKKPSDFFPSLEKEMEVVRHRLVAIIGPESSGKSTLCNALLEKDRRYLESPNLLAPAGNAHFQYTRRPNLYRLPVENLEIIDCPPLQPYLPYTHEVPSGFFEINHTLPPEGWLPEHLSQEIRGSLAAGSDRTQALIIVCRAHSMFESRGTPFAMQINWWINKFGYSILTSGAVQFVFTGHENLQATTSELHATLQSLRRVCQEKKQEAKWRVGFYDEKIQMTDEQYWQEVISFRSTHEQRNDPLAKQLVLQKRRKEDIAGKEYGMKAIQKWRTRLAVLSFLKKHKQNVHFFLNQEDDSPAVTQAKKESIQQALFTQINASPGLPMGFNHFFDEVVCKRSAVSTASADEESSASTITLTT